MSWVCEELKGIAAFEAVFPLVRQLRTHLDLFTFCDLLEEMIPLGYRGFVLREEGQARCYAGVTVSVNLYDLRHLWVYELVTHQDHRSRGMGAAMMKNLEALARKEGCARLCLSSGLQRPEAHRFYEANGLQKKSFAFSKTV